MRLLLLLCLLTVSYGLNFTRVWEEFKTKHKRLYSSTEEDLRRMKIFFKNLKQVERHNLEFRKGGHSFEVGVNEYADWEHQEFVSTFNGFKRTYNLTGAVRVSHFLGASPLIEVPATADWRQHGYVTPVKNQGACGSCWAFSTTGSLEGQNMRKTNKLVSLSEQNLVDCSGKYGNQGCDGGLMDQAFQYIKDNNGIDTEESYPYEAENDKCRYSPQSVGAVDSGFVDVPSGDEQKLMEAVATIGPISVAIDASHMSFQLYRRGIYDEPHCSSTELDHGVLVVGYGTDSGHDYWLIKNSWGTSWGDSGYVKIARNMKNKCGVATQASYPIV